MQGSSPPYDAARRRLRPILRRLGGGILLVGVLTGGLELALRLSGRLEDPSTPPSPVAFQDITTDAPPAPGSLTLKSWGTSQVEYLRRAVGLRVMVYGGSAVAGAPYSPLVSFASRLQQILSRTSRAAGGRPVEVINNGAIGLASGQVLDLVRRDLAQMRPDLVIIYSGNNEFFAIRGRKLVLPGYSPRMELLRYRLWSLRSYRLLAGLKAADRRPVLEQGISERLFNIPIEEADRDLATRLYRDNLSAIIESCRARGVPVMLVTVADNLRLGGALQNWAPEQKRLMADMEALVRNGKGGDLPAMIARSEELFAGSRGQQALGEVLLQAGMEEAALERFTRAEYLDPEPQRSNFAMRRALLDLASERGAASCDAAAALARLSPGGVPGTDVFFDWCHPNPLGHFRLARIIARCVAEQQLLGLRDRKAVDRVVARMHAVGKDPWRLEQYSERALIGPRTTLPPGAAASSPPLPPPLPTARAEAAAGFKAFVNAANSGYPFRVMEVKLCSLHLQRALEMGAPEGEMRLALGLHELYSSRLSEAQKELARAAALLPSDPDALNYARITGAIP